MFRFGKIFLSVAVRVNILQFVNGFAEYFLKLSQNRICYNISNKNIGLSKEVFSMKPVHDSYFKTSIDLTEEKFHEPENLGEHIKALIEKIKGYFIEEENI